jgi:hypothetical protein
MPPKDTTKHTKKRASAGPSGSRKRAKGTLRQPVIVDSQQPPPPSPPPITNALQALATASQAPTFEARIRESRPVDTIFAPAEGSEQATTAASKAPEDEEDEEIEAFDAHLMDNYNGLDWTRLKKYMKPLATQTSSRKAGSIAMAIESPDAATQL